MQLLRTQLGVAKSDLVSPVYAAAVLPLFTLTLFVSSGLLFLVQPMFAKMAVPLLGGTPQVWNTCMLFFQAALLGGYAYAHLSHRALGVRVQSRLHLALLLLPLLALPIAIPNGWSPPVDSDPTAWLLGVLLLAVGLPFFVVSTSGPLLQKWFSSTGHPKAADPYFLYAASNAGSMLALGAYPLLFEPLWTLRWQSQIWSYGYCLFVVLTVACAAVVWRARAAPAPKVELLRAEPLTAPRRGRWVLLGFVPSSLLLGVTTYFTSDLAAIPLFWVIPLSIYLLTFILVFGRKPPIPHRWMVQSFNVTLLSVAVAQILGIVNPLWIIGPLHLFGFFVIAMVCHGELAKDRPDTAHLTEFYFWLSVGGVLGGVFNAILAPLLFNGAAEYAITLVVAAFLCPRRASIASRSLRGDILVALFVAGAALGLALLPRYVKLPGEVATRFLLGGVPALLCLPAAGRPLRFGLCVGAVLWASTLQPLAEGRVVYRARSFFGVHRIVRAGDLTANFLLHGSTAHGFQPIDAQKRPVDADKPTGYYHPSGPIGQYLLSAAPDKLRRVAIVGLGTGALLPYFRAGQRVTFYEIDPVVRDIALNASYFTFVKGARARGVDVDIVLGDARLTLAQQAGGTYDLIVLDAFSGDHIPVHLVTVEAFSQVYLPKLAPHGVIAMHISNRYVDLTEVANNLAIRLKLAALRQVDTAKTKGKFSTHWALYARQAEDLSNVWNDPRWLHVTGGEKGVVWTDEFSNIVGTLTGL